MSKRKAVLLMLPDYIKLMLNRRQIYSQTIPKQGDTITFVRDEGFSCIAMRRLDDKIYFQETMSSNNPVQIICTNLDFPLNKQDIDSVLRELFLGWKIAWKVTGKYANDVDIQLTSVSKT